LEKIKANTLTLTLKNLKINFIKIIMKI